MNKSLYSLMLMDSVVEQIDRQALREGTNRSNLVNQILAEYVSLMTPEKRIDNIFKSMEKLIADAGELIPFFTPNQSSMSLKSSLEYKYRPTIRYVVQLYRVPGTSIGELNVTFRTQSESLLAALADFFRLWKRLEDAYIARRYAPGALYYELYDTRLVRSIALPQGKNYTNEELGRAIADYVKMFDELMKGYLCGRYDMKDLESRYVAYLNEGIGLI
ncbi:MAG TPA: hypothetical protein PLO47_05810 [Bacillota bacterium]|nr:hypothetical protein [Bacillota bacterium]